MKKSQLRKIIRESIKELITEQPINEIHQQIAFQVCDCQPSTAISCQPGNMNGNMVPGTSNSSISVQGFQCNNQLCQQSDIGQEFTYTGNFGAGNVDFTSITFKLTGILQPAPLSPPHPPNQAISSTTGTCCPPCNPSNWSNHQTWIANWTNGGPFNSNNPNQPCNHICNKITQWTTNCATAGPVQANQLACKIDEANDQATTHGCNC